MIMKKLLVTGTIIFSLTSLYILVMDLPVADHASHSSTTNAQSKKNLVTVDAATQKYDTIEDLSDDAPVIVKGKIIDSKKMQKVDMNKNEDNDGDVDFIYFTNKVLKVQKVYKGTGIKPGDEILIRSFEGEDDDVVVDSKSSVKEDKEYAIFLKPSVFPKEDGAYITVGFDQGLFELENGNSISKNKHYKDIKSLDDLEKKLKSK